MKLEERICACGCQKTFRCLPSSKTRYSSLHCMEAAGVLPPVEKFGRGPKAGRPAGATSGAGAEAASDDDIELDAGSEDAEAPLLLEDDDEGMDAEHHGDADGNKPPEVDPAL